MSNGCSDPPISLGVRVRDSFKQGVLDRMEGNTSTLTEIS
jgi:hypothetical protein